jgi:predicted ATPase
MSGASRAGKTTLGTRVAADLGITFLSNATPDVAKSHGFNAVGPMILSDRLALQQIILNAHLELIDAAQRPLIIDRTPIDFAAYLLAEFDMQSGARTDEATLTGVVDYVNRCLDLTVERYDQVFFLGPLDHYQIEEGKHPRNPAFQMHHSLLIEGLLARLHERLNFSLIYEKDLEVRSAYMHDAIVERLDCIERQRASSPHVH